MTGTQKKIQFDVPWIYKILKNSILKRNKFIELSAVKKDRKIKII